ncbi:hypothetical protein [Streptomyces ureilyticus]|nr:hypothetical protein [Streptomyces ureilyticus]
MPISSGGPMTHASRSTDRSGVAKIPATSQIRAHTARMVMP